MSKFVSQLCGAVTGVAAYLVKIPWSQWAVDTGQEVIKVMIFGVVGGAAGYLGRHIMIKLFFKNKHPK